VDVYPAGNGETPDQSSLKAALQRLLFSKTGWLALYFEGAFQKLVGRSPSLCATLDALTGLHNIARHWAGERTLGWLVYRQMQARGRRTTKAGAKTRGYEP
jgi:hypothetical protein